MRKPRLLASVTALLAISLSVRVVAADGPVTSVASAPSIEDLMSYSNNVDDIDASKLDAIRENGIKAGIQGGMIARSGEIVKELQSRSPELDRVFGFQVLVSREGYLPAVIEETNLKVETKGAAQRIEYAGVIYKVVALARFVRVAPTWRDYLLVGIGDSRLKVDQLPEAIRPKTDTEKAVWKSAVKQGWQQGIEQADDIFQENLARLKRDYLGMVRYLYLYKKGMVRKPVLAESPDGVHITADEIAIGTGAKSIEVPARMEQDQALWGK